MIDSLSLVVQIVVSTSGPAPSTFASLRSSRSAKRISRNELFPTASCLSIRCPRADRRVLPRARSRRSHLAFERHCAAPLFDRLLINVVQPNIRYSASKAKWTYASMGSTPREPVLARVADAAPSTTVGRVIFIGIDRLFCQGGSAAGFSTVGALSM
jgi:hypothetical protein